MSAVTRTIVGSVVLVAAAGGALGLAMMEKKGKQAEGERTEREKKAFPDLAAEDLTEVRMTYLGESVHAVKEGLDWKMKAPLEAEVDDAAISSLVSGVVNLPFKSRITDGELDPATVDLTDGKHVLRVKGTDGKEHVLEVGRKSSFNEAMYIRADGAMGTTEGYQLSAMQKSVLDLREKRLVKILSSDVEKIEVVMGTPVQDAVSFTAERRKQGAEPKWDDPWELTAPSVLPADRDEVMRVVQSITSARVVAFAPPGSAPAQHGLDAPVATIRVHGRGTTAEIRVGQVTVDGITQHWAQRTGSTDVGQLPDGTMAALRHPLFTWRDKRVADFSRDAAARLELVLPDASRVVLVKAGSDGGTDRWSITEPKASPALGWKVSSLLYTLGNLKASRFLEENVPSPAPADLLQKHGLHKPAREALVKDAAGTTLAHLWFAGGEGKDVAVMRKDGPAILAVDKAKVDDLPATVESLVGDPAKDD